MTDTTIPSRRPGNALFALAATWSLVACGGTAAEPQASCERAEGVICTFIGDGRAGLGRDGVAPTEVSLYLPQDMTWGSDGNPYVIDWNNHRVRTIDENDEVQTVIGTGELGDAPDGMASETNLNHPTHIAFSPEGKIYLSAWHNSKVMEMDPTTGEIAAVCGNGMRSYAGEGVPATEAIVDLPVATAFDSAGLLYIMDQGNQRIRRVEADGTINTVLGPVGPYLPDGYIEVCSDEEPEPGQAPDCKFCLEEEASDPECAGPPARPQGFRGEGDSGTDAYMNQPFSQSAPPSGGMEMGPGDVLYFTDTGNHLVRALHPDGTVTTVAGTAPDPYDPTELTSSAPRGDFDGEGVDALEAVFNRPRDVAVAQDGTIYVADTANSCVRRISPDLVVSTVVGTCGERGFRGDGDLAEEALVNRPYGVALDAEGNLYVADTYNHRIRVVYLASHDDGADD